MAMTTPPAVPVKVYGWAMSPFVSRPLLALEESGVDYELVPVDRGAGDHRRPEHLARNPFGMVPVLEDGDLTLFGTFYASTSQSCWVATWEQAAMVDVWLEVEAQQLHPAAFAIVLEYIVAPYFGSEPNQAVLDENVEKLKKVLEVYEARLSKSTDTYLAGDFLSLADLSHFTIVHYIMATEYAALVEARPHVNAWWEALAAPPAAKKVAEFMPVAMFVKASKKQE